MAEQSLIKMETPQALVVSQVSSLPSIAEVRQRMTWMTEFRPVLLEFVQKHMDPARHMYSFDNNRYTPLTVSQLGVMMAQGQKPALNQDGIHNLMSLYECYIAEPQLVESREDGFYTCRATITLLSYRTGMPMGSGTGSSSTRESKYAYRWLAKNRLPKGIDPQSLKQQERRGQNGTYTVYRLDNDDLADQENTVLKMAVKRAKSAGVAALPLVSEMFAAVGDPDEEPHLDEAQRQELLAPLGVWLKRLPVSVRQKAIFAVFGEPLAPEQLKMLEEERLRIGMQVIEVVQQQGIQWESPTLVADLKAALKALAAKATADLFGDPVVQERDTHHQEALKTLRKVHDPMSGTPADSPQDTSGNLEVQEKYTPLVNWRLTIEQYLMDTDIYEDKIPRQIYEDCMTAFHDQETPEKYGQDLASALLQWIDEGLA